MGILKKKTARLALYILLGMGNIATLLAAFFTGGRIFEKIYFAMWLGFGQFGDFFGPIVWHYQDRNVFENPNCAFPAFGAMIFELFARLLKAAGVTGEGELMDSVYGAMFYVMYTAVTVFLFTLAVNLSLKTCALWEKYLLVFLLIGTYPFMGYAVKTGNMVLFVAVLMLFALSFKDSDNRILKEAALLLIAVCAGMKLFPAVSGFLYLAERRWKEAGRLVVYGMIFCFVPFLFYGGIEGFRLFLENTAWHNRNMLANGTIPYYAAGLMQRLGHPEVSNLAGNIGMFLWIAMVLAIVWKNGRSWSSYLLFFSLFIVTSRVQQAYNLVYITLPLVEWVNEMKEREDEKLAWNDMIVPFLYLEIFYCYDWDVEYGFVWALLGAAFLTEILKFRRKDRAAENNIMHNR